MAASFAGGKNNGKMDNGGSDDYFEAYNEFDEHLNNMRNCDPEAVESNTNDYMGGSNTEFKSGGNEQTPIRSPFRGGNSGMRGRGSFTPDRGGFTPDNNRGGGFGNRGTPRGGSPFRGGGSFDRGGKNFDRGGGNFDRGGGSFDRGGGRGNRNGDRGSGGWRPRRPWGGPPNGRGRGNW